MGRHLFRCAGGDLRSGRLAGQEARGSGGCAEQYTHFYKNEFPTRYHAKMDTRRWGPGERIVFEPYTEGAFSESRDWIAEREIFEGGKSGMGSESYHEAVVKLS